MFRALERIFTALYPLANIKQGCLVIFLFGGHINVIKMYLSQARICFAAYFWVQYRSIKHERRIHVVLSEMICIDSASWTTLKFNNLGRSARITEWCMNRFFTHPIQNYSFVAVHFGHILILM